MLVINVIRSASKSVFKKARKGVQVYAGEPCINFCMHHSCVII